MQKKYIKGSKNYYITDTGEVIGNKGFKLSKGDSHGYWVVVVCYEDGTKRTERIHRLVAEYFLPPPTDEQWEMNEKKGWKCMTVNHKDGDKKNNHFTNLEWHTYAENNRHAIDTGLNTFRNGELSNFAVLTEWQVHRICEKLSEGMRNVDIIRLLQYEGLTSSSINAIRRGENWKHISSQYSFDKTSRRRSISDATAHWVCKCLQEGKKPSQILKETTCDKLTRAVIRTIQRHNAYHHITCLYTW